MKKIVPADIVLGQPLPFSIFDENGRLLLRRGVVVTMPDQVDRLIARNAQRDEPRTPHEAVATAASPQTPPPAEEEQSTFEQLGGLILNLKHVIGTALKNPEQIDVAARIGKIAAAVQELCEQDLDSALAAPSLDHHNPYIVVHQMMGAVLTELIARRKGLDPAQRLSLVCAALTRDFGQIRIQAELDGHPGPLPDALRLRLQQHPNESVALLEAAGVADPIWLQAVRGHHERFNGSGYPAGIRQELIAPGARILAVADIYGAMVKPRPYRAKAHFPQSALKDIYLKKDAEIDGEIAHALINQIGLFPPGTLVRLKCGEIAVFKKPTVKAEEATVYSIYGKNGMALSEPIRRETAQAGYEIVGLMPYAECRSAAITIKRVWAK
ncbi:MAG: HD domain-containing protein [Rhodocyclaceae bacterium]|nr:HD domain-containing protein [Rhodocyclaceae bacterium]